MASSSSLSFQLQLLRYTPPSSSTRPAVRPGTVLYLYRPSPSARLQQMQPTTKGRLKSVTVTVTAAASYEDNKAAEVGHHCDNGIAATTTSLLRHVAADEAAPPPPELRVGGAGDLCSSPKERPAGSPREDGGGDGRSQHAAAPTTFAKPVRGPTPPGLPAEGSGGNGGSKH